MENISISSLELKTKNSFALPQKSSELSGYSFWYYTSFRTANLILNSSSIYISNISNMNDVDEMKLHTKDKDYVHCLCLCNSNSEKIPLWYLYSGITGKGVSIGFTPSSIIKLIASIDKLKTVDGNELLINKDFDLEYGWVFYRKPEQKTQVCYKRKWYSITDSENFENDNYFIKSYPWEYEKEFRIVVHNKTGKAYPQLILDIGAVYDKLKVKLAPEISSDEFNLLLPQSNGFMKLLSAKVSKSNLGINMNLCKRNFESFLDYIDADVKNRHEIDVSKICSIIDSNCVKRTENEL